MAGSSFEDTNGDLYETLGEEWLNDHWGQTLLYTTLYDMTLSRDLRDNGYHGFSDYMMSAYGLDFDEWFDWDAWREQIS